MTDHQQTIFLFGALAILMPSAYVAARTFLAELKATIEAVERRKGD